MVYSLFVDEKGWEMDEGFLEGLCYFEEGWLVFEVRGEF